MERWAQNKVKGRPRNFLYIYYMTRNRISTHIFQASLYLTLQVLQQLILQIKAALTDVNLLLPHKQQVMEQDLQAPITKEPHRGRWGRPTEHQFPDACSVLCQVLHSICTPYFSGQQFYFD